MVCRVRVAGGGALRESRGGSRVRGSRGGSCGFLLVVPEPQAGWLCWSGVVTFVSCLQYGQGEGDSLSFPLGRCGGVSSAFVDGPCVWLMFARWVLFWIVSLHLVLWLLVLVVNLSYVYRGFEQTILLVLFVCVLVKFCEVCCGSAHTILR